MKEFVTTRTTCALAFDSTVYPKQVHCRIKELDLAVELRNVEVRQPIVKQKGLGTRLFELS
jgi:hypothetical protein